MMSKNSRIGQPNIRALQKLLTTPALRQELDEVTLFAKVADHRERKIERLEQARAQTYNALARLISNLRSSRTSDILCPVADALDRILKAISQDAPAFKPRRTQKKRGPARRKTTSSVTPTALTSSEPHRTENFFAGMTIPHGVPNYTPEQEENDFNADVIFRASDQETRKNYVESILDALNIKEEGQRRAKSASLSALFSDRYRRNTMARILITMLNRHSRRDGEALLRAWSLIETMDPWDLLASIMDSSAWKEALRAMKDKATQPPADAP
jgi:hypothetical protein